MHILKIVLMLAALSSAAWATPKLSILKINSEPKGETIEFNGGWTPDVPRLAVDVRSSENVPSKNLVAKVYFFDGSKTKLGEPVKLVRAHRQEKGETSWLAWPAETLEANDKWTIYFPVPKSIDKKWINAIVVIGANGQWSAKVRGSGNLADFDFPEKSKLVDLAAK